MSSAPAMNDTFCFFLSLETTTGSGSIIVTIFCSGFLRMVQFHSTTILVETEITTPTKVVLY